MTLLPTSPRIIGYLQESTSCGRIIILLLSDNKSCQNQSRLEVILTNRIQMKTGHHSVDSAVCPLVK